MYELAFNLRRAQYFLIEEGKKKKMDLNVINLNEGHGGIESCGQFGLWPLYSW